MMKSVRLIGLIALTATLAACQRGQDISYDGHSVTLHSANAPAATITSRGSFSVGSKLIDISPAERQLFLRYYNRIAAIHDDTAGLTSQALHMAGKSVEQAFDSMGGSSSSAKPAGRAMQSKGQDMQKRAQQLCHDVARAKTLQATLDKEVSAFQPYADIDPAPKVHC